jgi:hypothetical protein
MRGGRRSDEKEPGPDWRGTAWAARQRPAMARPLHAWAARHGPHRGGAGVSDTWALATSGRERERSSVGCVGRPEKEGGVGRVLRNMNIFDLFK